LSSVQDIRQREVLLPLLGAADPARIVAWHRGEPVTAARFLAQVQVVATSLPDAEAAVNLCEDRYAFLVAFCAVVLRGQTNLLPSSRAPRAVDEVMASSPGCYALGEQALDPAPRGYRRLMPLESVAAPKTDLTWPMIPANQVVVIGYTSGSTGRPSANPKTWATFRASNGGNLSRLNATLGERFEVVATVPPQHMYGIEMSVLLPLLGNVGVHAGRPFFPADVASALAEIPAPRLLVTTPVHLRALVESGVSLPPLSAMLSATAPLPLELARAAEQRFHAPLLEVFGSTETCVFASRRPTCGVDWTLYDDVALHPQPDGTAVTAPQLDQPVILADIVSLSADGRHFQLRGRHADLLEIAGKRASLGDLNRRLLAIPGVHDGVVFQLDDADPLGVHRIAALVVAPELEEHAIVEVLRQSIDPLFLPRPLKRVTALPRNETGKLPRADLLDLLHEHDGAHPR
jgi:acyl-coenzyme A synthetase/AMP-(fatty) acid ligase